VPSLEHNACCDLRTNGLGQDNSFQTVPLQKIDSTKIMYYYIIELIYKLLHQFELVIFIETVLFYFLKIFEDDSVIDRTE
jgi:hypothetical protein